MKGISIALFILLGLTVSVNVRAEGHCYPKWYIGSNVYEGSDAGTRMSVDTLVDAGESIWLTLSAQAYCDGECSMASPENYEWIHHGDTTASANFLVEDTGTYTGIIRYSSCGPGLFRISLHVKYSTLTAVSEEENAAAELYIYPTLSTGVFNIKSGEAVAKVQVRDCSGKVVFSDSKNISMIDI